MPVDFATVLNTLKTGVINLAEKDVKDYVAQATQDGQSILAELKDDLQNWTQQVATGALSAGDLADLVLGQKDEIEMVALKQAGLAEIDVDQFKADVFNLITTTLTALIP
jgi:hypothetical protein